MSVDREKFDALMNKARLETRGGDLVAEVWLMPFQIPAEIVSWGQRFFVLHEPDAVCLVYREGLMTFTIDPETGGLAVGDILREGEKIAQPKEKP